MKWPHFLGGVAILLSGLALEYFFYCNFFQRFGALLVAYTLCLVLIRSKNAEKLRESYSLQQKAEQLPIERAGAAAKTRFGKEVGGQLSEVLGKLQGVVSDGASKQVDTHKRDLAKLTYTELFLGVVGTMVWGFGDIATKLSGFPGGGQCPILV